MPNAREISEYFETIVPSSMKMGDDNVGLLVDNRGGEVQKALVALDVTEGVIEEAIACGVQLILAHHPLFFGLNRVVGSEPAGKKIIRLISSDIAALCMHTNLDGVEGGVSDCLLRLLGAESAGIIEPATTQDGRLYGVGRYGTLAEEMPLGDFLANVKHALKANGLRYYDAGRPVKRLACCGGSGGNWIGLAAAAGCDTYVTADIKYDIFQRAEELGINLIDADHYCTENVVIPYLVEKLREGFPSVRVMVSKTHKQIAKFF